MSIAVAYIFIVATITFIMCILYIRSAIKHSEELQKIEKIELDMERKKRELNIIRSKIKKCPYINTDDPRQCYFDSKYRCTWNEEGEICASK